MNDIKKMTNWFIDSAIERMKGAVEFSTLTLLPKGTKRAIEFAVRSVREVFEQANGVLLFNLVYADAITEEEQQEFYHKLYEAKLYWEDRALDIGNEKEQ